MALKAPNREFEEGPNQYDIPNLDSPLFNGKIPRT